MHRINILVALLTSVAHAELLPMNLPSRRTDSALPEGNTSPALLLRQTATDCGRGTTSCDSGCIPIDGQCCGSGDGGWCSAGAYCQSDGCCPDDEDCSGPATSCGRDRVFCGDKCMPDGAACCSGEDYFCGSGTICTDDGLCKDDLSIPRCGRGDESCGSGCIPSGQICCETYHCPIGYSCGDADFECAPKTGDGGDTDEDGDDSAMCVGDFEPCGNSCMAKEGTCCNGFYCGAGEKCAPGRKCEVADEEDTDDDGERGGQDIDGDDDGASTREGGDLPAAPENSKGSRHLGSNQSALLTLALLLLRQLI